ncbi:MAG: CHAT domain-containing protein [Deltaproteobacteria bacterium]|nr:CHAT domain-containing protein [Deltaproteobacteria bacterium]
MKREIEESGLYTIEPGKPWSYRTTVSRRSYLRVLVEQIETDLSVVLIGHDGSELFSADSPIGSTGEEELVAILEPGSYRVEVVVNEKAPAGTFNWLGAEVEPASEELEAVVAADRAHRAAWRLYKDKKAYDEALELYRQALEVWERLGLARRKASTLDSMAQAFLRKKQPEVAIALVDQAIEAGRGLKGRHDLTRLAVMLDRGGTIRSWYLGQIEQAIDGYFNEAITLTESFGHSSRIQASALLHRGNSWLKLGALQTALDDLRASVGAEGLAPNLRPSALRNVATVLVALHNSQEAYDSAKEARALALDRDLEREAIAAQRLMTQALILQEDLVEGMALAEKTVVDLKILVSESSHLRDSEELTNAYLTLGEVCRKSGDLSRARRALESGLGVAQEIGNARREAVLSMYLGNLERLEGTPERALTTIEAALAQFRELGSRRDEISAQARIAESLRDLGRLEEAEEHLEAALEGVEALRATARREDIRREYFAFRQEYFDIGLDIRLRAWLRNPSEQAAARMLEMHDRRLSIELRERWRQQDLEVVEGPGDPSSEEGVDESSLATQRKELERAIGALVVEKKGLEGDRPAELNRLLRSLAELRGSQRPEPAARSSRSLPIDLQALRQHYLDPDTLMLVYALGDQESLLWVLEAEEELSLSVLPVTRDNLNSWIGGWTESLVSSHPRHDRDREALGRELADVLLGPVKDRFSGKRLVIVADGALQALPFAALPDPRGGSEYLLRQSELSYLPSLAWLPAIRQSEQGRSTEARGVAAFVDAVFSRGDRRLGAQTGLEPGGETAGTTAREREARRNLERSYQAPLARLVHSATEGEFLLKSVDSVPYLSSPKSILASGFDANLRWFRSLELNDFGILHFGTHAFVDPSRPDLSGLVFSGLGKDGAPAESFLFGFEIAGMNLSADLVVLSACETARGRLVRGEGVLGLSRRFFDAGAARVLSTHWQVSDQPTAQLMTKFYEFLLGENLSPPAALRKAQLSILENASTEAAYFWAGFRLEGDWQRPHGW